MSKDARRANDPRATARAASDHPRRVRHEERPCGTDIPLAPSGLALTFDALAKDGRRHWRALLTWNEVTQTEAGGDTEAERYIVQLEHGTDGATALGQHPRRFIVEAKDEDTNTTMTEVVNAGIARRFSYRFRVRAISKEGRCRGTWSAWTPWQQPGHEAPPAPTLVTIHENTKDRIVLEWVGPPDPIDPDAYDVDIDHFQAKLTTVPYPGAATYQTPAGRKAFDHRIVGERRAFAIPLVDQDLTFYGWTRSANSERDFGPWIPATLAGNSSPTATPDGVSPLRDEVVATFTLPSPLVVGHFDALWTAPRPYKIKRVKVRFGRHDGATHPADGCPTGSAAILQAFWHNEDESAQSKLFSLDDRLTVQPNSHKDVGWAEDLLVTQVAKNEHLSVKCTQIGSGNPGTGGVLSVVLVPA